MTCTQIWNRSPGGWLRRLEPFTASFLFYLRHQTTQEEIWFQALPFLVVSSTAWESPGLLFTFRIKALQGSPHSGILRFPQSQPHSLAHTCSSSEDSSITKVTSICAFWFSGSISDSVSLSDGFLVLTLLHSSGLPLVFDWSVLCFLSSCFQTTSLSGLISSCPPHTPTPTFPNQANYQRLDILILKENNTRKTK